MLRGRQFHWLVSVSPDFNVHSPLESRRGCKVAHSSPQSVPRGTLSKGKLPRSKLTVPKFLSPGHSIGFDLKPKPESRQTFFEETPIPSWQPKKPCFRPPFAPLRIFSPERFQRRIKPRINSLGSSELNRSLKVFLEEHFEETKGRGATNILTCSLELRAWS